MDKTTRLDHLGTFQRGVNGASSSVGGTFLFQNSRSGSSNPGWKQKVAQRHFVASPYSRTSLSIESTHGSCGLYWKRKNAGKDEQCFTTFTGQNFASGQGIPSLQYSTGEKASALATAQSRLFDKLRHETSEANCMVSLGELRETIRMIKRPAMGFVRVLDAYSRSSKSLRDESRTRRAFLRGVVPLYLEAVFGWSPLVADIGALARVAARHMIGKPALTRISSTVTSPQKATPPYNTVVGPFDCQFRLSSVTTAELTTSAKAYIRTTVSGPISSIENLRLLGGFTFENFVPTAYELIPWSFVADYVSNLGDVISAATACQKDVIGYVSSTKETSSRFESVQFDSSKTIASVGGFDHRPFGVGGGNVKFSLVSFQRTVGGSIPVPDFQLAVPSGMQFTNLGFLALSVLADLQRNHR